MKIERPRGTRDILPSEQPLWRKVTGEMERLCALYGYRRIQTPVFEDVALFLRTAGEGSDIVQKEMYVFEDRGGRTLALRPEATAPICRAYVENGMQQEPQPVKLYTLATYYRYDKPQRGRYREHNQLSVESIGSAAPAVDAEVIALYDTLLRNLGITRYELHLNSIGDRECRPAYVDRLNAWLDEHADLLDADARQKRATSPLRVFDVKSPEVRAEVCRTLAAYDNGRTIEALDDAGIRYALDPTLVRGLDYYSRTTWEFLGADESTQASSISGGGRYDYLVEQIGGPPTPGVGFGAGIERLVLALEQEGSTADEDLLDVFVAAEPGQPVRALLARLRTEGISADADYAGRSMKGQIGYGQKRARSVLLVTGGGMTLRRRGELDVEVDEAALLELLEG